jgi:hypothetical protein
MTYGIQYTADATTITLPPGAFWIVTILVLGGLALYVSGVRDWIKELVWRVKG